MPPKPCAIVGVVALVVLAGCSGGLTSPSPTATACAPSETTARIATPIFGRPFNGDFPNGNLFDHDKPVYTGDSNGYLLSMCGTRYNLGDLTDGHNGYDWRMPEGTPLLAVADGDVVVAGLESPIYCPPMNRTVQGLVIAVKHAAPEGIEFASIYGHLSRIDVVNGQTVRAGDVIGRSGNTGCSGTPHLHFGALRLMPSGIYVVIDPYGWHSSSPDPWEADPQGAQSVWLWRDGAAPSLR
jgi:murein DD-endopeptidase MepM/ murein hydrolase activator NlpD